MKYNKGILLLSMFAAFLCGANLSVIGPLETWMIKDLSISHGQAGLIQSLFFIGSLLGAIMASWLFGKLRQKTFGLLALFSMGGGCLISGVQLYESLIIGRVIAGVGISLTAIFFTNVIVSQFEKSQASLLNWFHASLALGAALSIAAARDIAVLFNNWSIPFWMVGIFSFLLLLPLKHCILADMREKEHMDRVAIRRMFSHPVLLSCFLVMVCYVSAEQGALTFFAAYVEEEKQLPVAFSTLAASLYWAGMILGRIVASFISLKFEERLQIIGYTVVGAFFLLVCLFLSEQFGISIAIFLGGVAAGPIIPVAISHAVHQMKELKGGVVSVSNAACCLGGSIGPALAGFIGSQYSLLFGLMSVFLILFFSVIPFLLIPAKRVPS
ncbi:MAG: MFS transporter [SAR324 cluster bacterium]|nr:MFS transporter [SAR324 cluster bacterium]